ncbi:MAG: hypothetical protein LBF57_04455 [Holosporaceae bacterium]|jgi:hypothetical protein|nr:hypothetical protein [Holosporaceae bacterium]
MSSIKTLTEGKDGEESIIGKVFGDLFETRGGIILEKLMISVEKDMNNNGAVELHLVVVYDKELMVELLRMPAHEYFHRVDQLIKDYPDKMKIFKWELVANERLYPWANIKYPGDNMTPLAGFIYAKYSSLGEHRIRVPPSKKKIKLIMGKNDVKLDQKMLLHE